jgi:hypothetical protein
LANIKRANTSGITKSGVAIADVPDAPIIGSATASGLSASVAFTPAVTGGTGTTFTATSSPGSITGTSSTSPISVTGLVDGTSYTFTVKGSNSTGISQSSSSSNSITAISPLEGNFYSIASVTLSAATSSIEFTGIPTEYTHLQLRGVVRGTSAAAYDRLDFRLNNDSSANYYRHLLLCDGTTTPPNTYSYTGENLLVAAYIAGAQSASNNFASFILDIYDYADTERFVTTKCFGGSDNNGSGVAYTSYATGTWANTTKVSTIKLGPIEQGTNLAAYSSISLYGVK